MSVTVKIETKIEIDDPDQGGLTTIQIDDEGVLNLDQKNDNVVLSDDASIALAKIILQHHHIGFEPVFHEKVQYL